MQVMAAMAVAVTDLSLLHHLLLELLELPIVAAVVVVDVTQLATLVVLVLLLSSIQTAAHLQLVAGLPAQHHLQVALK
jgi:hypothetical protein